MDYIFDICKKNRQIFAQFLDNLSLTELNTVPNNFNNSIFWNIAHTVVTQNLLVYGLSNLPGNVDKHLIELYKKGTKHTIDATQADVDAIKLLLTSTITKSEADYKAGVFKTFTEYTVSTKSTLKNVEDAIHFNNFHEGIHLGYVLALKRAL